MADLEAAATEALAKVKMLTSETAEAQQKLGGLKEHVAEADARLDEDWTRLTERVEAFLQKVEEQATQVENETQQAAEALSDLAEAVDAAEGETKGEWEGARADVEGLQQSAAAGQPNVAQAVEAAQETYRALAARVKEVEDAMGQVLQETREFIDQQSADLLDMQQDLQVRASDAEGAIDDCEAQLDRVFGDWLTGLADAESELEGAFEEARSETERLVTETLQECRDGQGSALDALSGVIDTLEKAIVDLGEAISAKASEVAEAAGTRQGEVAATGAALEEMFNRLTAVKDLMASFSFVDS
jgi:DNA repair exonuclease SbcCD ATPase subunit